MGSGFRCPNTELHKPHEYELTKKIRWCVGRRFKRPHRKESTDA